MPDTSVGFQVDVSNIPLGVVSLLGRLAPVLRALSADNVSPLAVVQLEAIGQHFPISGPLAQLLPRALTRSSSVRLSRLQTSIGWMAGDTAAALSQTAGGQSGALLTLILVELLCRNMTGHLLYELSLKILPTGQCLADMSQLSDAAEIISNKLKPLVFGQHHACQLTRIRETYLHLGIDMAPSTSSKILDRLTVDLMVGLLDAVQQALREESSMLYIEGFQGVGTIVSLLTALCPDDLLLTVERGVLFRGSRAKIVLSVMHQRPTSFSLETVINGAKTSSPQLVAFRNDFQAGKLSPYDHLTMKMEGSLADLLDQLFITVTFEPTDAITSAFVDVITSIICKLPPQSYGQQSMFRTGAGLREFLGPRPHRLVGDKLAFLFGTPPIASSSSLDVITVHKTLIRAIENLVPMSLCICSECNTAPIWPSTPKLDHPRCPVRRILLGLQHLLGYAALLLFVETDMKSVCIIQKPQTKLGPHLCHALLYQLALESGTIQDDGESAIDVSVYQPSDLHDDLCQMLGSVDHTAGIGHNVIGTSSGATTIYPLTLETAAFDNPRTLRYRILDGQFHDGHSYYKALIEDAHIPPAVTAYVSLVQPGMPIGLSGIGCHSSLTMSLRPYHNSLALRVMVGAAGKVMDLSFHSLQLAYMAAEVASACDHDSRACPSLALESCSDIIATGVDAPLAQDENLISMLLTHKSAEAQFLGGISGVKTLVQGVDSCLACTVGWARDGKFRMIIQR